MNRTANDQTCIAAAQADMARRAAEMRAWQAKGDAARAAARGSSLHSEFTTGFGLAKAEGIIW